MNISYSSTTRFTFLSLVFLGVLIGGVLVGGERVEGAIEKCSITTTDSRLGTSITQTYCSDSESVSITNRSTCTRECQTGYQNPPKTKGTPEQDCFAGYIYYCEQEITRIPGTDSSSPSRSDVSYSGTDFDPERDAITIASDADLCTLKTSLSKDEAQALVDDKFKSEFDDKETVNNTVLNTVFLVSKAEQKNISREDRDKLDNRQLLCLYSSFKQIRNWLFFIAGFLTTLFIIIGGILWITAGDNEARVTKARKFLISAVVGLVIVLLSLSMLQILRAVLG